MLEDLSSDFIAVLQGAGAFVEYNQQAIVSAGEMVEYVCCIIAGRVRISRRDPDYGKANLARLGAGEWFGEMHLFLREPLREEIFADGEVVLWTIAPDALRKLFFEEAEGVQLLYNIAARLASRSEAMKVQL